MHGCPFMRQLRQGRRLSAEGLRISFRVAKNYRSKSAWTSNQRKRLNNQAVWPVILRITGPICARALKSKIQRTLGLRGHQDWPVMRVIWPDSDTIHPRSDHEP